MTSRFSLSLTFGAAIWCVAGLAHAGHPLVSDDTGTQGTGNWQLELNTDHTRTRDAGVTTWEREFNTAISYGLTENLDIAVNVPLLSNSATGSPTESGVGDATVLAK